MTDRGRPREYEDRVSTAVRLPRTMYKQLRHEAVDRDVSVNWLIVRACEELLKKLSPPGQRRRRRG